MKIGDKIQITLPKLLPYWIDIEPYWRDHLLLNDQRIATITDIHKQQGFGPSLLNQQDCIIVETSVRYLGFARTTLLIGWFQIVDDEKKTCDCPISSILTRGCQNSTHI